MLKKRWMPQAYVVMNLTNAKVYNGICKNVNRYWWTRTEKELNQSGTPNHHFLRAIQVAGRRSFHRYLFAVADSVEEIIEVEKQQILDTWSFKSEFGYNKTFGGEGCIATEETRLKQIAAAKDYSNDPIWRERQLAGTKAGQTGEWREKVRANLSTMKELSRAGVLRSRILRMPTWANDPIEILRILDTAFPKRNAVEFLRPRDKRVSQTQESRAARWGRVIQLYYVEHKTRTEVANILGLTDSQIRSLLTRIPRVAVGLNANGHIRKKLGRPRKREGVQTIFRGEQRPSGTLSPSQVQGAGASPLFSKDSIDADVQSPSLLPSRARRASASEMSLPRAD